MADNHRGNHLIAMRKSNKQTTERRFMKPFVPHLTHRFAVVSTVLLTNQPAHASDTDNRIESSAAQPLIHSKPQLKDDSIKTESTDGVVTLTGSTVAESLPESLAGACGGLLSGVKSVDNQLVVGGEQPAEHSDTWISMKVKTALLFHRNVSAIGTDVKVKDGVVILTGEASSLAQKELTTEYAKDIDHVKAVVNDMTIAPAPATPASPNTTVGDKIDDASITAEVKSSLASHESTSALHTTVSTTDGVVTLGGIAKNEAEKSLVTKLATDIEGVNSVINNMTIVVPV